MISKMQQYLNATRCRRQMLLSHFEGSELKNIGNTEKCCDNCKKKIKRNQLANINSSSQQSVDDKKDFALEAKMLFETIKFTNGAFGLAVPIYILRGSSNQRVNEYMKKAEYYGKGKHISELWWKALGRLLLCEKYLQEQQMKSFGKKAFCSGSTINITTKANLWLEKAKQSSNKNVPLMLEMSAELLNMEEAKVAAAKRVTVTVAAPVKKILAIPGPNLKTVSLTLPADEHLVGNLPLDESLFEEEKELLDPHEENLKGELFKQLMVLRNSLADSDGLAPYMVFSNKNLLDIAVHRPTSLQSMSQIEGITSARISKFGKPMTKLVSTFCKEHDLKEDAFPNEKSSAQKSDANNLSDNHLIHQLNGTAQDTYRLYETQGKDLHAVSAERGLSPNTVVNHLVEAIKIGLPVSLVNLGISQEIFDTISKVICSPPINSDVSKITPIKQLCPEYVEFNHIKVVIAVLQSKYGVNEIPIDTDDKHPNSSIINSKDESKGSSSSNAKDCAKTTYEIPEEKYSKRKDNGGLPPIEAPTLKKIKSSKLFKL